MGSVSLSQFTLQEWIDIIPLVLLSFLVIAAFVKLHDIPEPRKPKKRYFFRLSDRPKE